jgi:endoglucanase
MFEQRSFAFLFAAGLLLATSCKGSSGLKWAESSAPGVRVNQVGYLPEGPKWATVRAESATPLAFELRDEAGKVLLSGSTVPRGLDAASGDRVHLLDFSAYQGTGSKLSLKAGDASSFPFDVRANLYEKMKFDALKYFYHNRSGVEIVEPYVDDRTWTRPAGHLSDRSVPCWLPKDCSYELDVSGGWYDAGDHGKYVVNGGISAWTLLALHERSRFLGRGQDAFGDRALRIPESGNGVPDLLDEARFEVEFLLKMQVPEGQQLAGMVHHKMHDGGWSSLPTEPPSYSTVRAIHPPSTAATLNLAAVAAQAARIWKSIDPAFSARCLAAAKRAYAAALQNPKRFAPERDNQGGGPYSDNRVDDEFFWAAAELYLTTEDPALLETLKSSPFWQSFPTHHEDDADDVTGSMTWKSTEALGWISLAVVPSKLPDDERTRLRKGIAAAGDAYLGVIDKEGHRQPLAVGKSGKYPWGSNSFVLNNAVVLSLAYDFTKDRRYADGVVESMDYLFGRNPLSQSYVSGYGSVPLEHPHHRFWAASLSSKYPPPPPGAISGGPNSSLQDPQTRKSGLSRGLPPQKCFVDHIQAWSVNEVAINWNAPFAWVLAFLDEWRGG